MSEEQATKVLPCRTFVRVRPFTDEEATVCPEDSPVPREVVVWDGRDSLTVLDPQNEFVPRKNGVFPVGNVLWSFKDVDPTVRAKGPVATQKDVFARVVQPALDSIVQGYSAAFCVTGGSQSGRFFTLYGDDVEGPQRGLLPRFAEQIFDVFDKHKHADSTLTAEVEAVDVGEEGYVDLLAVRRTANPGPEYLKVQNGDQGPRLQGVTTLELKGAADFRLILKQLMRNVRRRTNAHTVRLCFTETFEFDDTANFGQPVRKSRHVQVLFALLRNMPSAFQRCVDVAVEHDSGENPLAKVPVRESAFTRLYPDLLRQGYHLHFVCCVSPYYEHTRDDVNTLQFAMKVRRLKGAPRLLEDESLVNMRRLADEVRHLKTAERKQNEAIAVVQKEINAREVELMKQEAAHRDITEKLAEAHKELRLAHLRRSIEHHKTRRVRKELEKELAVRHKEVEARQREVRKLDAEKQAVLRQADEAKVRVELIEAKTQQQQALAKAYEDRLRVFEHEQEQLQALEAFNAASPEEQKRAILAESTLSKATEEAIAKVQQEQAALTASDDTVARLAELQVEYDQVRAAEQPYRDGATVQQEIDSMQRELGDLTMQTDKLQSEINNKSTHSKCSVM